MATIWSAKTDAILAVGQSLDQIGVRNWALTRNQAITALDQLEFQGIAVLGGDVYQMLDGTLRSTYDNWYCDRLSGEANEAFITRSIEKARAFVTGYRSPQASERFFAIVPES